MITASLTTAGTPAPSGSQTYCIYLFGASGSAPLAQSCSTGTGASLNKNTSGLSQQTGTFRIMLEAKTTKTTFAVSVTHY
jgi:hypothetical protein